MKRSRATYCLLIAFIVPFCANADSIPDQSLRRNSIKLELVGRTPVTYSFIYDRLLYSNKIDLNGFVGYGSWDVIPTSLVAGFSTKVSKWLVAPMLSLNYYGMFNYGGVRQEGDPSTYLYHSGGALAFGVNINVSRRIDIELLGSLFKIQDRADLQMLGGLNCGYKF